MDAPHDDDIVAVAHAQAPCACCILSQKLLRELADNLDDNDLQGSIVSTHLETKKLREIRATNINLTVQARGQYQGQHQPDVSSAKRLRTGFTGPKATAAALRPEVFIYDCRGRTYLPGKPVDASHFKPPHKTVFDTTTKVDQFYALLGRAAIDNRDMDYVSSVHYGVKFSNAFWQGTQMVYGDGDGKLFNPFYAAPDVIAHELTHGVTQYESGLAYDGEAGGLNESISDVFGAVFNQWLNGWDVTNAKSWLLGQGLIAGGSVTLRNGRVCTTLRNMLDPTDQHALSPQPDNTSNIRGDEDPHELSGIPNKAFALYACSNGGQAWGDSIKVWYATCTNRHMRPDCTFQEFAQFTMTSAAMLAPKSTTALKNAWNTVGVKV